MSAVFSVTWESSRHGLLTSQPGRTTYAVLRSALGLTKHATQPPHSTKNSICIFRPVQYSPYPYAHVRLFHTSKLLLVKQSPSTLPHRANSQQPSTAPPTTKQKPPPKSETRAEEQAETDANSSTPSQAELNAIFGQEIDRKGAAELLSRLQRQRREGTLDQPLPYPGQLIDRGLDYLRAKYTVDEDAAIIARVDRELDGQWSMPQTNPEKSRTGRSGLEEIRRINRARREAEKAEREAEEQEMEVKHPHKSGKLATREASKRATLITSKGSSDNQGMVVSEAWQRRMRQSDAWIQKSNRRVAELREAATMKYIPQMSKWQRLWPSGMFTFGAVGLALAFAHIYTPPSQKARLFPDIPPAVAAVGTIVALNVVVFLSWRIPYAWKSMNRAFIVVPAVPHAFSMLGAEFSHHQAAHLATNMFALWFLGTQMHDDVGRGPFLALIVCGAVIPSFCSLIPPVMQRIFITATLGASGIISTLLGASCILHEGQKITFPFLPPDYTSWMNTAVVLGVMVSFELYQFARNGLVPKALINSGKQHVDYVGHLAGYATGIGAACLIRQTDPYWGRVERDSFWRWKDRQAQDPAAEVLMKPETLGIKADTSRGSQSAR